MLYEARGYRKVEDFSATHDDALECNNGAGIVKRLDNVNDERGGDLIDLTVFDEPEEVSLDHAPLVFIRGDVSLLLGAPNAEGVCEDIAARRFLAEFFFLLASELPRFF